MPAKKTHDQFLEDLSHRNQLVPGHEIRLCEGETYTNLNTKLRFVCTHNHPPFAALPKNVILNGSGCPMCGLIRTKQKNTTSHTSFLDKLAARNEKYESVVLAERETYTHVHSKLKFKCSNHSHPTWEASPASILQGHGCPMCGIDKSKSTHTYTHEQFEALLDTHNQAYIHKQVHLKPGQLYGGFRSPLSVVCNEGHEWVTNSDNILNGKAGCPICASSKTFSHMAIDWLKSIELRDGITIRHRGNSPNEFVIPGTKYAVDGYCRDTNTVYEFHGNYWHGNPKMFNHADVNERVGRTFGELYADTVKKENMIRSLGYNLVVLWEDEFHERTRRASLYREFDKFKQTLAVDVVLIPISEPYGRYHYETQRRTAYHSGNRVIFLFEDEWRRNTELVKHKLKHYTNVSNVERIHARKCVIRSCSKEEKKALLNANHIQGNDNSQIAYGAWYNDMLVAVMTFTAPRVALGQKNKGIHNSGVWELSRFCTDVNYRIPGIASKLLKHFQRNHAWTEIYSYADKRWSVGNMYHQLGFELVADNPPDYFYVIDGRRKHRWNYRKDILKDTLHNYDPSLTEYQNMVNRGYWRVWDCGTLKFSIRHP